MSLWTLWGHPAETRKGRLDNLKRAEEQAMGQKRKSKEARKDRGNMVANQNNVIKQVDSRISSWSCPEWIQQSYLGWRNGKLGIGISSYASIKVG